jgi:hypothetical protein
VCVWVGGKFLGTIKGGGVMGKEGEVVVHLNVVSSDFFPRRLSGDVRKMMLVVVVMMILLLIRMMV